MRKSLYKMFTYLKFGHLGKGHCIPIPRCFTNKIREVYPDPNDNCMSFHANTANEDNTVGIEDDGANAKDNENNWV